jgi:hypothetical protein
VRQLNAGRSADQPFIKKRALENIRREQQTNFGKRHPRDEISVEIMSRERPQDIIFFQPQELSMDAKTIAQHLVIVIMRPTQVRMFH